MDTNTRQLLYFVLAGLAVAGAYFFTLDDPDTAEQAAQETSDSPKSQAREAATRNASTDDSSPTEAAAPERTYTLESDDFTVEVSNVNAGLLHVRLKGERYTQDDGSPIDVVTTDKPPYYPLAFQAEDLDLEAARWQASQDRDDILTLTAETGDVRVVRELQAGKGPYQLWVTTRIVNRASKTRSLRYEIPTHHYVAREEESGGFLTVRAPGLSHGLCRHGEEMERHDREELLEPHTYQKNIQFTGVENVYFLRAIATSKPQAESCYLVSSDRGGTPDEPAGSLFTAVLRYPRVELKPGESKTYRALAYMGPKMPEQLAQAGHHLKDAIDLGFFASLSGGLTWLLRKIHEFVGNWGLAIILLTLSVKLLLYPLTERSFKSMARMRQLKPEMDRINEMYADDREKKGAAIMELYRKHQINPLGGCLPQLLQLPIWWALYTSLSTNVELFRAPFILWWNDLSSPDPFFVLPLGLGLMMFLQQKLTPTAMDPAQAKMMMYMMPVMITSFMLFLPAGLCLYMFTNSALSIGQQQLIERRLAHSTAQAAPEQPAADEERGPTPSSPPEASSGQPSQRPQPKKSSKRRSRRGRK